MKLNVACCFSNKVPRGGALPQLQLLGAWRLPGKGHAVRPLSTPLTSTSGTTASTPKDESKITYPDVQDCLVLVSNNFSTQTSYENQTKKAITNKFIQDAMNDFLREQLEVYFIENPDDGGEDRRAKCLSTSAAGRRRKRPVSIRKKS